jgi:hypothetical protein
LSLIRSALLAIFVLASAGILAELLLLEHFASATQFIPLVLVTLSLLLLGWFAATRSVASVRVFRLCMYLFLVGGTVGVFLHYNGNALFVLSVTPEMKGSQLFWKSITGVTPALAPGSLVQIGLVGLAWTFRHPVLALGTQPNSQQQEQSP